jgi:hypothetical protein
MRRGERSGNVWWWDMLMRHESAKRNVECERERESRENNWKEGEAMTLNSEGIRNVWMILRRRMKKKEVICDSSPFRKCVSIFPFRSLTTLSQRTSSIHSLWREWCKARRTHTDTHTMLLVITSNQHDEIFIIISSACDSRRRTLATYHTPHISSRISTQSFQCRRPDSLYLMRASNAVCIITIDRKDSVSLHIPLARHI